MKMTFIVELRAPQTLLVSEVVEYLETAISCWNGSYHPEDPLQGVSDVKVLRVTDRRLKEVSQ